MNIEFEKYVHEHRDEFDDLLIPDGHKLRFEQKLDESRKRRPLRFIVCYLSVAAMFILGLVLVDTTIPVEQDSQSQLVEQYYISQINKCIEQIQVHIQTLDPQAQSEIESDLKQIQEDDKKFYSSNQPMDEEVYLGVITNRFMIQKGSLQRLEALISQNPTE